MHTITRKCGGCRQYSEVKAVSNQPLTCPACSHKWGQLSSISEVFESCPICQCRQFYVQKDFNQALGCLILLLGIYFVPKTYGLSLPLVALIDWLFYKRTPFVVVCYRCGSEFRGFKIPERLKHFMHHIGAKYDKYRK